MRSLLSWFPALWHFEQVSFAVILGSLFSSRGSVVVTALDLNVLWFCGFAVMRM